MNSKNGLFPIITSKEKNFRGFSAEASYEQTTISKREIWRNINESNRIDD